MPTPTNSKALTPAATRKLAKNKADKKQTKLITILKDDHNYDIISEIVTHMKEIKRAKKIKPLEKHRMLMNYNLTLLSYCMPKLKVLEDDRSKTGDKIQFNINVGGNTEVTPNQKGGIPAPSGGVNISIPAVKQIDGSYGIEKETD